jgi:hypothetical protein
MEGRFLGCAGMFYAKGRVLWLRRRVLLERAGPFAVPACSKVEERAFRPAFELLYYCHLERSEAESRDLRFAAE